MAWTTGRILLQLSLHRVQRQSFASTTPDGSSGQKLGPIETLESESGTKLNMGGFPKASKSSYMECLFSKWLRDNRSIHGTWHRFFKEIVEEETPDSANDFPSTQSDSNVKAESEYPRQEDTLSPQPKFGSVLPAEESVIQVPEQMIQQKTPDKPEKATKGDQKVPLRHRRIPKFSLFQKFAKFRRQASQAQRIPRLKSGLKWRSKGNNTMHFKTYYEEKLNKEKGKSERKINKWLKSQEKPQDKPPEMPQDKPPEMPQDKPPEMPQNKPQETPQPSREGGEVSDPNPTPKTLAYESLVALIHDLDNSTMNMSSSDPNYQEILKKMKPWKANGASNLCKMPSDIKSFTDLPRALIDDPENILNSEATVLICEDKATESITSAEETAGPEPESLTEKFQSPLGDVTNKESEMDASSQQPSDP